MEPALTVVLCLLILVFLYMCSSCKFSCGNKDGYVHALEFQKECNDDGRRHCTLSDGTAGKCVLNGYCSTRMLYNPADFEDVQ